MGRNRHDASSNPRFNSTAPPKEWEQAYAQSLRATCLAKQASLPTVLRNRPVPRAADHHYDGVKSLSLTNGATTFYFY